jgi:hypothetical protein
MKRYSTKIMCLIVFFAANALLAMESEPTNDVYATNESKYTVFIKIEPALNASMGGLKMNVDQQKIVPGDVKYLGRLKDIMDVDTSGDYAAYWTTNKDTIQKMKQDANGKKNLDLYIKIGSSVSGYYITGWNWAPSPTENKPIIASNQQWELQPKPEEIPSWMDKSIIGMPGSQEEETSWMEQSMIGLPLVGESKQSSPKVIKEEFNEYPQLKEISNGAWGNEYAQKVNAICSFDYTRAQQSDASNLCADLKKMFSGKTKVGSLNKDNAQRAINSIYERLKIYQNPGYFK